METNLMFIGLCVGFLHVKISGRFLIDFRLACNELGEWKEFGCGDVMAMATYAI